MDKPPFDICERSFQYCLRVVKLSQWLDQQGGVARTLSKQLVRSGTSIGANVEEGQAAQSRADFASKYSIARKEARETRYWLRILLASQVASDAQVGELVAETDELVRILTAIIKKTRRD